MKSTEFLRRTSLWMKRKVLSTSLLHMCNFRHCSVFLDRGRLSKINYLKQRRPQNFTKSLLCGVLVDDQNGMRCLVY